MSVEDDLRRAQEEYKKARENLDVAVLAARAEGWTWSQIGHILGVSRQAAWERFRNTKKR